jgi:hypothetical protein
MTLCACQVKVFDPTESSGLRILGEMSYSELQERLGLAKSRAAENEEERRLTIIEEKRAKQEELKGRVENIVRVRGTSPLAPLVLRLVLWRLCAPCWWLCASSHRRGDSPLPGTQCEHVRGWSERLKCASGVCVCVIYRCSCEGGGCEGCRSQKEGRGGGAEAARDS